MPSPLAAILWAQWRCLWNPRGGGGLRGRAVATGLALIWYALWTVAAVAAALLAAPAPGPLLAVGVPWVLMAVFLYWQLAPVATASLGASLDLGKLLVYPISERQLFRIEVLLRLTTAMEMLLVLAGLLAGLLANPAVPWWGPPLALPLFALFNLFVAAGLRSLLERLFAYRRLRELVVLLIVLAAALPQLLTYTGVPAGAREFFMRAPGLGWPWTAAGRLALGESPALACLLLATWTLAGWVFSRRQFRRGLRFDRAARAPAGRARRARPRWRDALYRFPGLLFADPLAAAIEKELRSLARTPRFRLVFLMGFSFGFVVWLPMLRAPIGGLQAGSSYPVFVSIYALVLLAEVVFWNSLGFDRSAAQFYFVAPVPFATVLRAKNLAVVFFVVAETGIVLAVCALLRVPLTAMKVLETYSVTLVECLYLLATGNLSSLYYPRPVNPEHTWARSGGGRFQLLLLVIFPALLAPVLLAYAGRYAFDSEAVFYSLLGFAALAGAGVYWVALDSSVKAAAARQEALLDALGRSGGPIASV